MSGADVVVTGAEYTGGLAALRGLRAAGFRPWAALTSLDSYGGLSRAAVGVFEVGDPRVDPRGFAADLAAGAARVGARVVLPGTEPALLALAEHVASFPEDVAVGVSPLPVVLAATDKLALPELAAVAGLRVPPTTTLTSSTPLTGLALPAVLKPLRSEVEVDGELRRVEVCRVRTRSDLARGLATMPGQSGLHQPYLSGRIRTVNGVAWHGELVTTVHKLALRTWPTDCGVVSHATTTAVEPALQRATAQLMRHLGWSGLFNLQFIETPEREHYLIDLNPRIYHSLALAIRAGANLPAIWTMLLLGQTPSVHAYRRGVHFRAEEDFRAITAGARHNPRALAQLLPKRRTTHPVVTMTDPRPALITLRRLAGAFGDRRRRGRIPTGEVTPSSRREHVPVAGD